MKKGIALTLLLVACSFAGSATAAERWKLEFEPVKLDRISIQTGMHWQSYWYLVYKVTNKTDETLPLRLSIKATSDVAKKTYRESYYKRVVEAINKKSGKEYLSIKEMRTTIDAGETKEAVAVFGSVVESTDVLKIEIKGLWDRLSREGPKTFIEDRVLELTYHRPGDEYYPQDDPITLKGKKWIVAYRKEVTKR